MRLNDCIILVSGPGHCELAEREVITASAYMCIELWMCCARVQLHSKPARRARRVSRREIAIVVDFRLLLETSTVHPSSPRQTGAGGRK
jgi:hypothetical protein